MLREWFKEGIDDGDTFRQRFRWALVIQCLVTLGVVTTALLTYSP